MTCLIFYRIVITEERVVTPESDEVDALGEIETPKPMSLSEIRYGYSFAFCLTFRFWLKVSFRLSL